MDIGRLPAKGRNNLWYRYNDNDAVLVFVHGVLSDSRGCWLHEDKATKKPTAYWPELIESDSRFKDIAIYLGGYLTAFDSGDFPIEQCALEVFSYLSTQDASGHPPVLDKRKITFVCHSMGGIVVRELLCERWEVFKDKDVGIVLIASPSFGSQLADSLQQVIRLYNHRQGGQLRWGNDMLEALDTRFRNLYDSRERKIRNLRGVEFFENQFVIHCKWLPFFARTKIVTKESASRYFGYAKQVGGSDHFSICKPASITDRVHQFLCEFLVEKSLLPRDPSTGGSAPLLIGPAATGAPSAVSSYQTDRLIPGQASFQPQFEWQPPQGARQVSSILVGGVSAETIAVKPRIDELFEIITDPDEIPGALFRTEQGTALAPYDVAYVKGREGVLDVQKSLEFALVESKGRLLVHGLRGIGKTREICELAHAACAMKWKILVARAESDARLGPPQAMPAELIDSNLMIIVENLHARVVDDVERHTTPYLERLEALLAWLERYLPGSVRIVATTRDEPHFASRLDLPRDGKQWRSFVLYRLPTLTDDGLRQMLAALAARAGVLVVPDDVSKFIENSDHKPGTVFINVDSARQRRTPLSASVWKPTGDQSWELRFLRARGEHAGVDHICQALHVLAKAGLPARVAYVASLARASGGKEPEAAVAALVGEGLLGLRQGVVAPFSAEQMDELLGQGKAPVINLIDSVETLEQALTKPDGRPKEWAEDILLLAVALAKANAADRAEQLVSRAIDLGAAGSRAYRVRAGIRFERRDFIGAEADSTSVLAIDADETDALVARACTRNLLGSFEGALNDLQHAIRRGRDDSTVHMQLANAYYQLHRWDEAESAFTDAIAKGNESGVAFFIRGTVRLQRKNAAGAEEDFTAALDRGVDLAEIVSGLRQIEREPRPELPGVSRDGAESGKLIVCALRGFARFMLAKHELAETDLTLAIAGRIGERFRGYTDAAKASTIPLMANVRKQLEKRPFQEEALLHIRGLTRLHLNRPAEAESDFDEALARGFDDSEVYFARGSARMLRTNFMGAEQDAMAAVVMGREDAASYSLRGFARLSLERFAEAERDFDKAIELKRDDATIFAWRGTARMKRGKLEEAESDLTAALDRQADAKILFTRGCLRFDRQRFIDADQDLTAALNRGFDQPSLFVLRGLSRLMQNQVRGAEEDAVAAFARGAKDIAAHSLRAGVRIAQGQIADAEPDLNVAIELGRNDQWVFANRGLARQALGRHTEAEEDFSKVIALGVNDRDLLVERGRTRLAQKKWPDAEQDLVAAIKAGRDDAFVHLCLGEAKKEQRDYVAAGAQYDLAVARDRSTRFLAPRALFRVLLGNFRGAEEDLDEIVDREPPGAVVLHMRGIARHGQSKFLTAIADYNAALVLSPNDKEILGSRVIANIRLENIEEAEQDCQRLAAIDRDADQTEGSYGELRLARGDFAGALLCFERVAQIDVAWRFWEGLAFLMMGRVEEAHQAYKMAAAESPPFSILLALDELEFCLNRHADRLGSESIQSAARAIKKKLEQAVEKATRLA